MTQMWIFFKYFCNNLLTRNRTAVKIKQVSSLVTVASIDLCKANTLYYLRTVVRNTQRRPLELCKKLCGFYPPLLVKCLLF